MQASITHAEKATPRHLLLLRVFAHVAANSGGDVLKEFQEQQEKMQEDMGDAGNPMEMFQKMMSGELGAPPEPKKAVAAGPAGADKKRAKREKN